MPEEDNLRVNRVIFEAWNSHDVDRFVAVLDEAVVWESDTLPAPARGREDARATLQGFYRGFPDLDFEVLRTVADGDFVVTQWRSSGTNKGELLGIAPTHRGSTVHGCTVIEFRGGKAAHIWDYWDFGTTLRNLGLWPPAGRNQGKFVPD
ncbi:MAG: ester cyclase [Armatimonadota bacterium]